MSLDLIQIGQKCYTSLILSEHSQGHRRIILRSDFAHAMSNTQVGSFVHHVPDNRETEDKHDKV